MRNHSVLNLVCIETVYVQELPEFAIQKQKERRGKEFCKRGLDFVFKKAHIINNRSPEAVAKRTAAGYCF